MPSWKISHLLEKKKIKNHPVVCTRTQRSPGARHFSWISVLVLTAVAKLSFHTGFAFAALLSFPLLLLCQSILERVWIGGVARFFQLFSSLESSADSCCLEVLIRKEEIAKLAVLLQGTLFLLCIFLSISFFSSISFFFSFFSIFFFFSISFFSSFPCENLSKRLVPQRIVEGDLQWIVSKKRTAQICPQLSPGNAGTTGRDLDIS